MSATRFHKGLEAYGAPRRGATSRTKRCWYVSNCPVLNFPEGCRLNRHPFVIIPRSAAGSTYRRRFFVHVEAHRPDSACYTQPG